MKTSLNFPKKLLAIDTNAKTVKGQKYGFMTGILYLAPADISGHQVCSMAELAGCKAACLYTSGRGAFNSVQQSRLNKTKLFFAYRQLFMENLAKDIERLIRKAKRENMIPLVRLNGTSDIRWENVRFDYGFGNEQITIFELFPEVQFYDYTKISNRKDIPANYDLTFSYSGTPGYLAHVQKAINAGMRIAAVFRSQKDIPSEFMGMQCVDGDNSDIRHMDPQGVIVALYAKGKAKADYSGFVVDSPKVIPIKLAA
jgi:hypothetical protein